jgi:hypothetical protein
MASKDVASIFMEDLDGMAEVADSEATRPGDVFAGRRAARNHR